VTTALARLLLDRPGATPDKPWGRPPYSVQGQTFTSQSRLAAEISRRREQHDINVEFEDPVIAEVINSMHPEVRRSPHRAVRFPKRSMDTLAWWIREQCPASWRFEAYFVPLARWQDVTAYPWRKRGSPITDLKCALRAIFREHCRPRIAEACGVDGCGRAERLEFDHIEPSFDEIAQECIGLMTAEEIATKFDYDQFDPHRMTLAAFIPRQHPAVVHMIATHRVGRFQWLCREHHQIVTAERRREIRRRERPHVA
jgi:hypothetical protein